MAAIELVNPFGANELNRDMPILDPGRGERLAAEPLDLSDHEVRRPDDGYFDQG
jgi:hypothetical protein